MAVPSGSLWAVKRPVENGSMISEISSTSTQNHWTTNRCSPAVALVRSRMYSEVYMFLASSNSQIRLDLGVWGPLSRRMGSDFHSASSRV